MKSLLSFLSILAIVALFFSSSNSRTWYIKEDGTGDAPTIQAGIDSSTAGDTVLVAPDTYHENLLITSAHNGICVLSESGADVTTVIAAQSGTVVDFVGVDTSTVLKGFTLTGGTGAPNPEHPGTFHGGGIRIFYCSPSIIENIVRNNSVEPGRGGGIQCFSSAAIIEGNNISYNSASFHGGGIHVEHGSPRIAGNTITNNSTPGGGAVTAYYSTIVIADNYFRKNDAGINGGAIVVDHCDVEIVGNIICDNFSQSIGGGVFLFACTGILSNNTVTLNRAGSSGGFAFLGGTAPTVQHNLVVCNTAQNVGGIGCDETTNPYFSCNDVWNNSPSNYGGNCSDQTGINGNISSDPLFCDIYSYNLSLTANSPALIGNCGVIGAVDTPECSSIDEPSCEHPIGVKTESWGNIKSRYRK